jgi:hypothetical protein
MTHLFANLTHFGAMVFFALVVSITFAFLSKRTAIERLQYSLWAFLAFLVIAIGIGWIMYPFSR